MTEDDTFRTGQDDSSADLETSLSQKVRNLLKMTSVSSQTLLKEKNTLNESPYQANEGLADMNESGRELFEDRDRLSSITSHIESQQVEPVEEQYNVTAQTITGICTQVTQEAVYEVAKTHKEELDEMKAYTKGLIEINETVSKNCTLILSKYEQLSGQVTEILGELKKKDHTAESDLPEKESEWETTCSNILLDMATKIESLENTVRNQTKATDPTPIRNTSHTTESHAPEVHTTESQSAPIHTTGTPILPTDDTANELKDAEAIIIHDSNANGLEPEKLHHEKKVLKRRRFTLDQAKKDIPKVKNPSGVKDVVFMTGLNDSRQENESVQVTLQKQKETCQKYSRAFPNANLHIAAVAPISQKQVNLNTKLREFASKEKHSFIDNQGIFDRDTKKIRPNMLQGIHYTDHALRIVAKEVKRSLYKEKNTASMSTRNISNNTRNPLQTSPPGIPQIPLDQSVLITALAELTKATQAILQKVSTPN